MRYLLLACLGVFRLVAQPYGICNVSLRVVDYQGRPVPYHVASFIDEAGKDYADQFEGSRGRVPCSEVPYTLVVSRGIVGADVRGSLVVARPEVSKTLVTDPNLVILNGQVGSASFRLPPYYVWKGQLAPPPQRKHWVNIRSVVAPVGQEAEVSDDGEFRIYNGFVIGRYMLTVVNDEGRIVYSTILDITKFAPLEPLEIPLGAEPTLIVVR